jgi:hypothetical protein
MEESLCLARDDYLIRGPDLDITNAGLFYS